MIGVHLHAFAVRRWIEQALGVTLAGLDVLSVADEVSRPVRRGLERLDLAASPDLRPRLRRLPQAGEVERALCSVVAAYIALSAQPACGARRPVEVLLTSPDRPAGRRIAAVGGEPHGEVRHFHLAYLRAHLAHRLRLGHGRVRRSLEGEWFRLIEELFDLLVVLLQFGVADRPIFAAIFVGIFPHEGARILAQHHVGVDERSASETARYDHVEVLEAEGLEHSVLPFTRSPEVRAHAVRRPSERAGRIWLPALE